MFCNVELQGSHLSFENPCPFLQPTEGERERKGVVKTHSSLLATTVHPNVLYTYCSVTVFSPVRIAVFLFFFFAT